VRFEKREHREDRRVWKAIVVLTVLTTGAGATSHVPSTLETLDGVCLADLRWMEDDLARNYAGYEDKILQYGRESFAERAGEARAQAIGAVDEVACDAALWRYLAGFHDHHLLIRSPFSKGPPGLQLPAPLFESAEPSFLVLSDSTALVRIPSFAVSHGRKVASLMEDHDDDVASRPFLIIDLRQNGGGGDGTFAPLLPLIYTDTFRIPGLDHRATVENGDRWEVLLNEVPGANEAFRTSILAFADTLRSGAVGWIPGPEETSMGFDSTWTRPREVAVLVDRWCASACEQFLYLAGQSRKVRVYGEATTGAVDYLNLVIADMPSGQRRLMYPISRSGRLPEHPIDPTGILPDVHLDEAVLLSADGAVEAVRVRMARENGGRAPGAAPRAR
jgi:hypothetical protein